MKKISIIGLGYWGPHYLRILDALEGFSVMGHDINPINLSDCHRRYPHHSFTTELQEALEGAYAVVIATPASTHKDVIKQALSKGAHVLCEKPLVLNKSQAHNLHAKAKAGGLLLRTAYTYLYHPATIEIKELLKGREIKMITCRRTNLGPERQDCKPRHDLMTHDISMVYHWLEGAIMPGEITEITDTTEQALFYGGKLEGDQHKTAVCCFASWGMAGKNRFIQIVTDKHIIEFRDTKPRKHQLMIHDSKGQWARHVSLDNTEPLSALAHDFIAHTEKPEPWQYSTREMDLTLARILK